MPATGLSGFCGADQPPDLVQAQPLERLQADLAVAVVGRIERAAEQADALSGRRQPAAPSSAAKQRRVTKGGRPQPG